MSRPGPDALLVLLRAPALRQPATIQAAYAAVVVAQVGVITAANAQIRQLETVMGEHFGRRPDADIYLSQPGLGPVLGARVLGEFGDDRARFADARGRKNYSGQSPITRVSGKKTVVLARYATNRRLGAALHQQAFSALQASQAPGPTTTRYGHATPATTPRCASSRTASSASCTAA